jgi:AbrB family looped-hinge helix DNA binding protein
MKALSCENKSSDPFQIYGMTVVGERGQIVIPVEARKKFDFKKGDQFLVIAHGPKHDMLGLIPMSALTEFVENFRSIADTVEQEVKKVKKSK